MDAHWVKVFDRADHHALILVVTHDFHLVFFPAEQALFDQHFGRRREIEAVLHHFLVFFTVVGDAATGTTKREAGANNNREIADRSVDRFDCFGQCVDRFRLGDVEADLKHCLLKDVTRFAFNDGFWLRADHFDAILLKDACIMQIHRKVESGLPTERRQQGVGSLLIDDLL